MADLHRTISFAEDEDLTNTKLHQLIDTTTVDGIEPADFSNTTGAIFVQNTAPTGKTGDLWFQTSVASALGRLYHFDGNQWVLVGEGFLGTNAGGTTIGQGAAVVLDTTNQFTDSRLGVVKVSSRTQVPIGVAIVEIPISGGVGPVITKGRAIVLKDGSTPAIGDPIIWDGSVNGQMTTGAIGSWGQPHGTGSIGRWTQATAAASAHAFIEGSPRASWIAAKNNGGSVIFNNVSNPAGGALGTWSGSFGTPLFGTWAGGAAATGILPGTVGHIVQVRIWNTSASGTDQDVTFALRARNATVALDAGAASFSCMLGAGGAGSPASDQAARAQLIVWETTGSSTNQVEYYINSLTGAFASWVVHVQEVGIIAGGAVV